MLKTPKKLLLLSCLVLLGVIGFTLIKSQSAKVVCKPATTPWKVENYVNPTEYYAGYFPNVVITQVCTFNGHITRGQLFRREVAQGLVFCLRPMGIRHENDGWNIAMTDENDENCKKDFSSPVTLPRHGWTSRDITGYYLAEEGGAEEIFGSEENPISIREFNFIFSKKDYEMIWENWTCWTYGFICPSDWGNTSETPRSRGIFIITNMKLGNLASKDQVWIESIDFIVQIYLPTESPTE